MEAFFGNYSFILIYLYKIGPFFLFASLVLGVVGLPIPDELLLMGAGYLIAQHKLHAATTIFTAILGSICGITISYFLGRLFGILVVKKFGSRVNITEEKVEAARQWFIHIGKWILIIGYFIPLLRHLFGFVAGGAKMDFRIFAFFAYLGALIWSITFLSIGYYFHSFVAHLFQK